MALKNEQGVTEVSGGIIIECHESVQMPIAQWTRILSALPDELAVKLRVFNIEKWGYAAVPKPVWLLLVTLVKVLEARH